MKNIHILPTDKPSRLQSNKYSKLFLSEVPKAYADCINQNIYITNDEEIKEGDWCYQVELNDGKVDKCYDVTLYHTWTNNGVDKTRKFKKIILTTDQDLIEEGVQAIDDEFLEWFVNNPSCDEVRVGTEIWNDGRWNYFLPKEEPKQETFLGKTISKKDADKDSFEDVTKYKIEKGYSEEEMLKMLHKFGFDYTYNYKGEKTIYLWIPEWFEEYKRLEQLNK